MHISQLWNPESNVPLTYLIHDAKEPADTDALYESIDKDLITTMALHGKVYNADNTQLFNMLKPLILGGPGWSFIQTYNKKSNGREAYLTLK